MFVSVVVVYACTVSVQEERRHRSPAPQANEWTTQLVDRKDMCLGSTSGGYGA